MEEVKSTNGWKMAIRRRALQQGLAVVVDALVDTCWIRSVSRVKALISRMPDRLSLSSGVQIAELLLAVAEGRAHIFGIHAQR